MRNVQAWLVKLMKPEGEFEEKLVHAEQMGLASNMVVFLLDGDMVAVFNTMLVHSVEQVDVLAGL